jgi:rubredoxin
VADYRKRGPICRSPQSPAKDSTMNKHRCQICGYDYEPEAGDPDNGIVPGTPWEDVPDDWACIICGAGKDAFDEL